MVTHRAAPRMTTPTMPEIVHSEYSLNEEVANSLTHAFGLVLSVVGLILLLMATRNSGFREIASCALYGTTLVLVYSTSMLCHGVAVFWYVLPARS